MEGTEVIDQATAAMRDSLTALEAEEKRLTDELATVKDQRKNVAKALESLTGDKPKGRRRGRPPGSKNKAKDNAQDGATEPVAA